MLLLFPERMSLVSLNGRLFMPEHRDIWRAMAHVNMRSPDLTIGAWWVALRRELHALLCDGVAEDAHKDEGVWSWQCEGWRTWGALRLTDGHATLQTLPVWLDRLERCVEARRLVEAAQEQAERAWRGDIEGARHVMEQAAGEVATGRAVAVRVGDLDV